MALDYFHRVIVTGPSSTIGFLRRRLARTSARTAARLTWRERIPFSIVAICELVPSAKRVKRNRFDEPYDIRVWPTVQRSRTISEIRYQLHTRDFELTSFIKTLSRAFPTLSFHLSTHYLDGGEVVGFQFRSGMMRRWLVPQTRRQFHWDRARVKFAVSGDAVYDHNEAELLAEDGMRDEALDHWQQHRRRGTSRSTRRSWWNKPVVRDFMEELDLRLIEVAIRVTHERRPRRC
jgi:hypothetical protein